MKKILVPVDFSEKSQQALDVAVQTAKKKNAKLYVLHCVELPVRYTTAANTELPEALYFIRLAQKNLTDLCQNLAVQGVNVVPILETNSIVDSVDDAIKKEKIDFIVMGSAGASGMKEVLIGSNAEKVVRSASVPVLVVKEKTDVDQIKQLVFACDFSQKYQKAIDKALDFSDLFDAKINFVYINTPYEFLPTYKTTELIQAFKNKNQRAAQHDFFTYNDMRIEDGIMNFTKEKNADLICMFPAKRSLLTSLFNTSISEDIVNHSEKPVLTFKLD